MRQFVSQQTNASSPGFPGIRFMAVNSQIGLPKADMPGNPSPNNSRFCWNDVNAWINQRFLNYLMGARTSGAVCGICNVPERRQSSDSSCTYQWPCASSLIAAL
jgi:hypothetical protein